MKHFLSIQNTYTHIEMALFQGDQLINGVSEDKLRASKQFVPLMSELLQAHHIRFSDLSFLAVNQGPGPFTTLRVVIASVNGLSYATKIPLVGVDALDALILEHENSLHTRTIALLNAFNQEVYFGISSPELSSIQKGYKNIHAFLQEISSAMPGQSIRFIGNAAQLYAKEIDAVLGAQAHIAQPLPHTASIGQIGLMGLQQWERQENVMHELYPLYLKQATPSPVIEPA